MGFFFPGDVEVGGNLNLDSGSNIVLPSGSDIVLGEGANILGTGDLDGSFSGSFTGSFSGSFLDSNIISSSEQIRSLGFITGSDSFDVSNIESSIAALEAATSSYSTSSADLSNINSNLAALNNATSSFLTSSTPFDPSGIQSSLDSLNNATSSFLTSSTPFDPSGIQSSLDSLNNATSSFLTSSTPFDPSGIQSSLDSLNNATSSFLTSSTPFDASGIQSSIDALELATSSYVTNAITASMSVNTASYALTASFALNAFDGVSASYAQTASHALQVPFDVISDLPSNLVSSSQQISDFGFVQTTGSDPNLVASASHAESASYAITASHALNAFNGVSSSYALTASFALNAFDGISASYAQTASHALQVPFDVISDLPENLVSGSQQISDFGFITSSVSGGVDFADITNVPTLISGSEQIEDLGFITGSDTPGLVDSASLALRAEKLEKFENVRTINGDHALLMTFASESAGQTDGRAAIAGTNTSLGSLKFNPNRSGDGTTAQLTIGAAGVTGILNVDRIDMNADIIISDGVINLLGVSNGGYLKFSNITLPNAGAAGGGLASSGGKLQYASGSSWHELFFTESQIDIGGTTGNISGSRVIGDIQASSVDYDNVLNKPTLISGSQQITDLGFMSSQADISSLNDFTSSIQNEVNAIQTFTSSIQSEVDALQSATSSYLTSSGSVDFDDITNKPSLVSGSSQIDLSQATGNANVADTASYIFYDGVDTAGAGWVSSSAQITLADTTGNISGSRVVGDIQASSVEYANVLNKPALVSGSAQVVSLIDGQDVNLGVISAQEFNTSIISSSILFTSGSNIFGDELTDTHEFTGSLSITGSLILDGAQLISASEQISGLGFITGSETFDASNIESSVTALEQATSSYVTNSQTSSMSVETASFATSASLAMSVDFNVITGLPSGLLSSSAQISNATASKINTSDNNTDNGFSVAFVNSSGSDSQVFTSETLRYNPSVDELYVETLVGTAMTASYVSAGNVNGTVSRATSASYADMAGAVDFNYVENLPANLVSSSAQVDEFNSGLVVKGGNLKLAGNIALELSGSSGVSTFRYRTSEGDNKIFMTADHDNDFIKFSNRASNGYFNFFANNATEGASGEQKVAEFRHDEAQFFQKVSGSSIEVSGTITGDISTTTGNISGSRVVGDIQASSVEFDNVLNKPTLFSGSSQLDNIGDRNPQGNYIFDGGIRTRHIDSIFQAHTTFSGSSTRVLRYQGDGKQHRNFLELDVVNDEVTLMNRAADGNVRINANNSTAGIGGNVEVANFTSNEIQFFQPITGSSITASIDASNVDGTVANATSASIATTSSYVDMDDIDFSALTHYDDDTAAATGGVPVGKLYRNGNFIQVRLS